MSDVPVTSASAFPVLDKPTTTDVAAILRARTKDLDGNEVGDFTDSTRPTGTEVGAIIDLAYNEVTGRAGAELAPRCASLAKTLVVIRAAMWVEGSYWPEQVRSDRSIFAELAEQFTSGVVALEACVAGNLTDDGTGGEASLRFGMLNVHGWTSVVPPFGVPEPEPFETPVPVDYYNKPPDG